MEQAADRSETAALDRHVSSSCENVPVESVYGHRETDRVAL